MATQNPIEQEGTYPLPEAQLDRFMLYINIDYPSYEEELTIVQSTTGAAGEEPIPMLSAEKILQYQAAIRTMPVSQHILEYAVKLARSTRPGTPESKPEITKWINWGAGPRASQYLVLAAKARAALDGRLTPSEEDIRAVALPVLTHRVLVSFAAEAEGIKPADIIQQLLS
jgi:MoxR-like ATPase